MHSQRSAFSFLEILTVLLIMGLLGSLLARSLANTHPDENSALHEILRFDQDARRDAHQLGSITVQHRGLRLIAFSKDADDFRHELRLQPGTRFRNSSGKRLESWQYDQHGSSIDFIIVWPQGSQQVAGLCGVAIDGAIDAQQEP